MINRAKDSKREAVSSNLLEKMKLEHSSYKMRKLTGGYSGDLISFLKETDIITDSGEEGKWVINLSTILGSSESGGTYPVDVYVLELQGTSSENGATYVIKYYDSGAEDSKIVGEIADANANTTPVIKDDAQIIIEYLNDRNSYDSETGDLIPNKGVNPSTDIESYNEDDFIRFRR